MLWLPMGGHGIRCCVGCFTGGGRVASMSVSIWDKSIQAAINLEVK